LARGARGGSSGIAHLVPDSLRRDPHRPGAGALQSTASKGSIGGCADALTSEPGARSGWT